MPVNFLFIHVNEWATLDSPDTVPISQGYLLAYLRKHGFDGTILGDYKGSPLAAAVVDRALKELQPKVIGFSVYEENINRVRLWGRYLKKKSPDFLTIIGGPQVTFMPPEGLIQLDEMDILCRGEGETVMLALARALESGAPLDTVPGISFKRAGEVVDTPRRPQILDLNTYPSPYLDSTLDPAGRSRLILLSSRGCTSPCTFCYTSRASEHQVRFHSLDRVTDEMLFLKERGIRDFWFADPNFAYSRTRLTNLLERIIDKVPDITFWCQTRYNLIDEELLALLKRAGAHTIAFGLESADPDVLARIKKGLDPDRMTRVIRMVKDAGIEVELFTIYGLPGETFARGVETLRFVRKNGVAIEGNSISQQVHLFHGTPISADPAGHGVRPLAVTKPAYLSVCRDFETDAMTKEQIRQLSLLWRLNRTDFAEYLHTGRDLFTVAGFISKNRRDLTSTPDAEMMLARIYLQLEEYEAASACFDFLEQGFGGDAEVRSFLDGDFTGYKIKRRTVAKPGSLVIYDCRATVNGRPAEETEAYFQDAILGRSHLLPEFEAALIGLKSGRITQCELVFPEDYGNENLAGRKALFMIYLHQALDPVPLRGREEVMRLAPRNIYRYNDLPALKEHNQKLYYLTLRDHTLRGLTQDMNDFLALLNFYLRLDFRDKVDEMLALLPPDRSLHGHVIRILAANGRSGRILSLLPEMPADNDEAIERIKALIALDRLDEAEGEVLAPRLDHNVQALDLRVGLASLREKPVAEYLKRMADLLDHQILNLRRLPLF